MEHQIIFGNSVNSNPTVRVSDPVLSFPGVSFDGAREFCVNEDLLSRHILLLGGSGCGKTNAFSFTLETLRRRMTAQDVAIIFDTKGEFYDMFHRQGDFLIGNSARFRPISHTWNIFEEILADGDDEVNVSMNAREIASALFSDRGSSAQPFFCNAARDLFRCVLMHFVRQARRDPATWQKRLNNADLVKAFRSFRVDSYIKICSAYEDMHSMLSYFGDGSSNQALGVFGELNSMLSDYFVGILASYVPERSLSMRKAVRQKGGRAIFVEYDIAMGETLTPIYRLLIDQALKEALGRRDGNRGNVYLIADEFKLLPRLQHIDDALNFGRGLGVKVMAGLQSIDQLYEIYGRDTGAVIAGGFGSLFAFHTNDNSSRDYITKRFGSNVVAYGYYNQEKNQRIIHERDGNTVEEWEQMNLGLGQAVIGLGYEAPFLFQFEKYGEK